jgi:hypothetical protein
MCQKALSAMVLAALTAQIAPAQNRVGNIVTGRAKAQVLYRYNGATALSRPDRVLIRDFPTEGRVVIGNPRFHHHLLLHHDSDDVASADEVVKQVRNRFAETIGARLEKDNVRAERLAEANQANGPELVISGEFTGVNVGNARKRIMIGFGRGASDIRAHVILTLIANGRNTVLLDCRINSQSGKEPGALVSTSGVGIAAGTVLGALGDSRSSTVEADASRMGALVAELTASVMAGAKWLPNPQAPTARNADR